MITGVVKQENLVLTEQLPKYALLNSRNVDRPLWRVRLFQFVTPLLRELKTRTRIGKFRVIHTETTTEVEIEINSSVLHDSARYPQPLCIKIACEAENQPTGNEYVFKHCKDSGYVEMMGAVRYSGPMRGRDDNGDRRRIEALLRRASRKPIRKEVLVFEDASDLKKESKQLPRDRSGPKERVAKRTNQEVKGLIVEQFMKQESWRAEDLANEIREKSGRVKEILGSLAMYDQHTGLWTMRKY